MGAKVTGCTIHFADDDYDNGPIIVPAPRAGAGRRHARSALPNASSRKSAKHCPKPSLLYAEDRLKLEGRHVHIAPKLCTAAAV